MKHDYTDEEIKTAWKDSLSLRAFLEALPTRSAEPAEIAKLKAERKKWEADALRYCKNADFWRSEHDKAQAVAAVVLAQAVRRMEAVPVDELWYDYEAANTGYGGMGAVRARLLAAAKGEGQAKEIPQAEPAQPTTSPGWTPAVGDVVRSTPEMALGGQMYWRDLAIQLARVWWKCHNIGASLQHGDLNKDIAFSIVCERHGGRVFHGDTPENAWNKAEEWLLSPDRENFTAACLTPAQP